LLQVSALVIDVHKGPALDALSPLFLILSLDIFENLSFRFFWAVEVFELFLEPLLRVRRLMNLEFPVRDIFPVDLGEEWMLFDFICSLFTCSKTLTRVPVEQMDNQILGFYRHAHWKFQDAALDVVEQLRF